jgi:G3E family GTPase
LCGDFVLFGLGCVTSRFLGVSCSCLVVSADACSTAADVITALQSRVDSCPHVIVTVSDMIPIVPLCEWIASSEVAQIVSVVACINVLTAFTDARETKPLPVLATQCCRGFVQHILLTNCDTIGEETIVKARGVVSAMNPVASFVRLPGGMATPVIVPAETLTPILENSYDTQPHISLRTVWKRCVEFVTRAVKPLMDAFSCH